MLNESATDAWLTLASDNDATKGFLLHQYVPIPLREVLGDKMNDAYNVITKADTATIDVIESTES